MSVFLDYSVLFFLILYKIITVQKRKKKSVYDEEDNLQSNVIDNVCVGISLWSFILLRYSVCGLTYRSSNGR